MNNDKWRELKVSKLSEEFEPLERELHINYSEDMGCVFRIFSRCELVNKHLQDNEEFILDKYYTNDKGELETLQGKLPLSCLRIKSKSATNDKHNILSRVLM